MKNPAAVALGKIKSAAKSKTARENGKLGGRPKGKARGKYKCSRCGRGFRTVEKCLIHKITCGEAEPANAEVSDRAGDGARS
jgi:tRNA(Ile2) C34 agmatinyltransferase TiaS